MQRFCEELSSPSMLVPTCGGERPIEFEVLPAVSSPLSERERAELLRWAAGFARVGRASEPDDVVPEFFKQVGSNFFGALAAIVARAFADGAPDIRHAGIACPAP